MKKKLRICFFLEAGRSWIGGIDYISNIISALDTLEKKPRSTFDICLLCNKSLEVSFYDYIQPLVDEIYYMEEDLPLPSWPTKVVWLFSKLFFKSKNHRLSEFFISKKIDFVYPFSSPHRLGFRWAAWIPDFQHKHFPNFFTKHEFITRDRLTEEYANHSSMIVLSSESALRDFRKCLPNYAGKTKVLPFRFSPQESWYKEEPKEYQDKYFLPDEFFIVSNQLWQHKNHLLVLEALLLLREKAIFPNIVFTGHFYDYREPSYLDKVLRVVHEFGIARQVYILGLIPKIDQIQLMRRSVAVIQPSLFEGWSTVVENSRALGKDIILSDIDVHLEQNPPHSKFFKHSSLQSLAEAMASKWEERVAGPDFEKEAIARERINLDIMHFARNFLDLCL